MAGERLEDGRQRPGERVGATLHGEAHTDSADRLGVGPVHHRALVRAERADAVAGTQEREVLRDDGVEQPAEVLLDPVLDRRLLIGRVAGVERPAAQEDP